MSKIFVLWGKKENELLEDLITETMDPEKLRLATAWAEENGFSTRVLVVQDGVFEKPNFVSTVKI